MRLGSETNSLTNHVLSRAVIGQPTPEVGMGATILCWTDRHGATITAVETINGATVVTVQEDRATRTDKNGQSESQTWTFEPNPNGAKHMFRMLDGGRWEGVTRGTTGRLKKAQGPGLRIGERDEYYDPCF